MKKIVLLCALGVSTGMLVTKMKKAAEEQAFDVEIAAYSVDDFDEETKDADLVLLGPQVSFMAEDFIAHYPTIKIEQIDMLAYGTMDGKRVIDRCIEILGK